MGRRAAAIAIVLLIAGLAPASAIIGYCAHMPCCHHASRQQAKVSAAVHDCCTTVACYEAPSVKLTASTPVLTFVAARVITPALLVLREPRLLPALTVSPPATTQQRLAILSILLI